MKSICFLVSDMSWSGGTTKMTQLLANEFSKDHRVYIVSLHVDNEIILESNHEITHITLTEASKKTYITSQIIALRRIIKREKIEFLINVDVGIGFYGILAAWGISTKVITWEHSNYYNNWRSKIFPYLRRFATKYSDALVVLTVRDKNNYFANIKTKKPIYVISNPVSCHAFSYNSSSKTIVSAGLLLPIKGYDLAIKTASQVLKKHPDWKWVICGEGPERERLESLISKYELDEQFLLMGSVQNMDEQYMNASMFVMTSQMEGLPMVLLEAKSWGLPLVSFDIMTGPSDIIRNNTNGCLVEPYNTSEMASKINYLINNPEVRIDFSNNSQLDMDRFNFKNIISKWYELLEEI